MTLRTFYMRKTIGFLILLVILGVGFFVHSLWSSKQTEIISEPQRATLSGEYVCLSTSSNEDHCEYGLKTDSGEYYIVNFYLMFQTADPLVVGQHFSANGVIVQLQEEELKKWAQYPVVGMFSVTDSLNVETVPATTNQASIGIGETATIDNVSITPQELVSDSRCPIGVTCIWAGTVEVRTTLATQVAHGEHVLSLGTPQVFGEYLVMLIDAQPRKTEAIISSEDYVLIYEVTRSE